MEISENGFIFSDKKDLLDLEAIHYYLSVESYWAKGIPLDTVKRSIENSLCFGIYKDQEQVGFARWITDKATFAWLCDVYVKENYRGLGLAKKLMSFMIFHPDLQGLRTYRLGTLDAHGLYKQFGFEPVENPERLMAIVIKNPYGVAQ
ncbi:GNAT family N-acetyltransferase [Pedobacter sp. MR2016-19]|uniref:GNAT family N-acetyltransferase n=1 Tax=Pedobacter sp. MR2016-19 TaxID=2780089 RepID=UPI0018759CEC|nr:GNAT family N-acetyltransferase [Pedobacter sp. MR2016-19]MBE5319485.1 GNAT family N-acetyltransferase [Pedobacter sp. MR2016-19]